MANQETRVSAFSLTNLLLGIMIVLIAIAWYRVGAVDRALDQQFEVIGAKIDDLSNAQQAP